MKVSHYFISLVILLVSIASHGFSSNDLHPNNVRLQIPVHEHIEKNQNISLLNYADLKPYTGFKIVGISLRGKSLFFRSYVDTYLDGGLIAFGTEVSYLDKFYNVSLRFPQRIRESSELIFRNSQPLDVEEVILDIVRTR